jgi:hypothetical protein
VWDGRRRRRAFCGKRLKSIMPRCHALETNVLDVSHDLIWNQGVHGEGEGRCDDGGVRTIKKCLGVCEETKRRERLSGRVERETKRRRLMEEWRRERVREGG